MNGDLFYLGFTRRTAPLFVRERLAVAAPPPADALRRLGQLASGRLLLTTCERFEIYAGDARRDLDSWLGLLSEWSGIAARELADAAHRIDGLEAARRLLRVAAGLESRIIGEPHILGQVRSAYLTSQRLGAVDAVMSALARAAIHAGRRVRQETAIGRPGRSIVSVVMEYLASHEALLGCTVLVVGTGALAADLVGALAGRRAGRLLVVSRCLARAETLARRWGGMGLSMDKLSQAVAAADVVVACTSASDYVVNSNLIGPWRTQPLHLIDLGVPRNVDPRAAVLPRVHLVHMDDLACDDASQDVAVAAAARIVNEELDRFAAWRCGRAVGPTIARLLQNTARFPRSCCSGSRREVHRRIMRLKLEAAA